MDSHNLFMTPTTYRLVRLEYAAGLATALVLLSLHLDEVRWPVFLGLFAVIDVVGYLPGAVAYRTPGRRDAAGRIARPYYVLYNVAHSLLTAGAVALLWCWLVEPEWALLALAVHLCGDRALFGNFLKPFGLSFEPSTHPAYQELVHRYEPLAHHPLHPTPHPSSPTPHPSIPTPRLVTSPQLVGDVATGAGPRR